MRQMIKYFSLAIFAVLFLSLPGGLRGGQSNGHTGSWASSNQLLQARSGAASELLADGRILVTGGADQNGSLKSAEYIAADGSVSAAPPMQYARSEHASVLLPDGRVLVAGGIGSDGAPTNSSEIFDPAANSWTTTGAMVLARSGHTASLLPNGKVLIAGGEISSGPTFYLEVFDPESNAFSLAGALLSARAQHGAVVLEDGRVLIIGGTNGSQTVASTEIFDGDTQSVSPGPDLAVARENFSVTRLLDGRILVAGGNDGSQDLSSAEVFDPAAQNASLVNSALLQARSGHLAFLLPHNNGVLIVGGSAAGAALSSAELYLPWRNAFVSAASLGLSLEGATGQPLQGNGLLLVAGGKTPALSLYRGTRASRDGAAPAPQALAPQGPPAMVAVGNTEIYQFATLVTDQDSYAPGDAVAISGTGWQAGETVTLLLHQDPQSVPDQTLQATADGAGNIAATMISPDSTDPDVTYYLTATGKASEAQAKFTGKRSTTTAVNSSNNPSLYGEAVTFTAVVSAGPGKKTPNGSVQFQADGVNLGAPITTTNCGTNGSACAYITTLSLTTGSHAVQAIFTGTGNSLNSTSPVLAQTVQVGSSSTALVSSANPSALGQPVTFTATVSVTAGLPTGSVTFKDGGTVLGTTSLNPGGWTTLSTSALASGAHSITAVYSGDGNIAGSTSAVLAQTVSAGPSTVAVVSSLNPALLGQPVTFTATVSVGLGAGTPTGTVTFKDGTTVLGTGTLNAGGWTTLSLSSLTVGSHSITAVYGGDTSFGGSSSDVLTQTVNPGP